MPTVENIVVKLEAKMDEYSVRIADAERRSGKAFSAIERQVAGVETQMKKSAGEMGSTLKRLAGFIAATFTGRELIGLTDAFTEFQNGLRVAGVEGANLKTVQDALFASAQRYGVELNSLGQLYGRASQAAGELGASQEELLTFTDNISAAVKVQGGNVQQASGALLQLAQALQSGTVRAEEFNSINEGLFPVLQAVANGSDRFAGSTSKLRAAIIDGTVSSREFFTSFQDGAEILRDRAATAALTTSAAITTLQNALEVYFGEADKSSGVSVALGKAIGGIADNLDILIPALATLGTALGVGFVTNAVAARVAAAQATGAFVTMRAAALAAFGGPIGIAITGITVAIGAFAIQAAKAEAAIKQTGEVSDKTAKAIGDLNNILSNDPSAKVAKDAAELAKQRVAQAKATYEAAKAEAALRASQGRAKLRDLQDGTETQTRTRQVGRGPRRTTYTEQVEVELSDRRARGGDGTTALSRARAEAQQLIDDAKQDIAELDKAFAGALKSIASPPIETPAAESEADRKKREKSAAAQAKRAEKDAEQRRELSQSIDAEVRSAEAAYLSEVIAATDNAAERARLQMEAIEIEKRNALASIADDEALNSEENAARRDLLEGYIEKTAALRAAQVAEEEAARLAEQNAALTRAEFDRQLTYAEIAADLADTRQEQLLAEQRIIDLIAQRELADIHSAILAEKEGEARQSVIDALLAQADAVRARAGADSQINSERNASPLDYYLDRISDVEAAFESVELNGIRAVEDGLVRIMDGTESVGSAFKKIANQIISDLIRVQVQQQIVAAFSGGSSGGGGGGIIGGIAKFFGGGKAAGGPVSPNTTYRVGENGPELLHMGNQPGRITPNGQMGGYGGGGVVELRLNNDMLEATVINGAVRVTSAAAGPITQAATANTFRQARRPQLARTGLG
jgi:tape measure domain-containing protein|tara:strand:+ start:34185 stop:36947 length:2763 start_codon:yes stop_codon:yes gene_type:complete